MTKKIMTEKLERSHSLEQNQYDWLLRKNIQVKSAHCSLWLGLFQQRHLCRNKAHTLSDPAEKAAKMNVISHQQFLQSQQANIETK
jgi:hypothetical protein